MKTQTPVKTSRYSAFQHPIFRHFKNGADIGTAFLCFGHFDVTVSVNEYGHRATPFEASQGYYSDAELEAIRADGLDFVRLCVNPANLWNPRTSAPKSAAGDWLFRYMERIRAADLGMVCNFFHNGQQSAARIASEGGDPVRGVICDTIAPPINYWTRAEFYAYHRYAAGLVSPFPVHKAVYEAWNEPGFMENKGETYHPEAMTDALMGEVQTVILPAAYKAIRSVLPKHGILLPSEWGSSEKNLLTTRWPKGLDSNVAMVAHLYHDYGTAEGFWQNMGRVMVQASEKYRCPVFVTEYGAPGTDQTAQAQFLSLVKATCNQAGAPASAWSLGKASITGNTYQIYNNAAGMAAIAGWAPSPIPS